MHDLARAKLMLSCRSSELSMSLAHAKLMRSSSLAREHRTCLSLASVSIRFPGVATKQSASVVYTHWGSALLRRATDSQIHESRIMHPEHLQEAASQPASPKYIPFAYACYGILALACSASSTPILAKL